MPANYRAPSVGRALKILELVAESQEGLGISQLARRLAISKGTVFGLCRQLEEGGALLRNPLSKRFGLGPLVATLAGRGFVYARLRDTAGPELAHLRDTLGESIFLGVQGRREVTVVEAWQPTGQVGISAGPGTRLPLTAGSVGKVFLAGMPPSQLEEVLASGLPRHTPQTITDPALYRAQLDDVRSQGYALEQDEYLIGVWGVAAGLGVSGGLPAAIWSIGFASAPPAKGLDHLAQALLEASRRIARQLTAQD